MQDPRDQYPKISPPQQTQPEPGLDKAMTPQADHGGDTYEGMDRLKGRKALITGADSGIGRAVALAYIREGAAVAINYLESESPDVERLKKDLGDDADKLVCLPGDLTDETFARSLVRDAADKLGGLDIVVNNAGKQRSVEDIANVSTEQLEQTFTVNVFALVWIVQEALVFLRPGATIINTSSIQATQPSPDKIDYAATKAAITSLTKGLSMQLAPKGIRVNAVAPGPVWTPLQPSHGQQPEELPKFGHDTPLGRAGQPAELAGAYVFLASQESSYVTGAVIAVTGGKLL
jgi:NAD(P)-dependent dehydrogenase (short-subunit alcohol dehydrogenase family)